MIPKVVTNDFSGVEDTVIPQSVETEEKTLSEEQKYIIKHIVREYCPRVTEEASKCWGMFTTPEAKGDVASSYEQIPYVKMGIEIIKEAKKEPVFCHIKGQTYAKGYVQNNRCMFPMKIELVSTKNILSEAEIDSKHPIQLHLILTYSYIHTMNTRIRQKETNGWSWVHTPTLKLLQTSAVNWQNRWSDSSTRACWLKDVSEWNTPEDILSRKETKYWKSKGKGTGKKGLMGTKGFATLEQCIQHASGNRSRNNKWTSVYNDMLWYMMIEYGPKVGSSRIFTALAQDNRAAQIWPMTRAGRRDDQARRKRRVRELLRQRWDSLGLWAMGLGKSSNYSYTAESQLQVLDLMKKGQIPFPRSATRHLKRKSSDTSEENMENLLLAEIHEKRAALMEMDSDQ